jgi:chorismate mutase
VTVELKGADSVPDSVPDSIPAWRAAIDVLDEQVIGLLQQRMSLASRIQQRRLGDGGSRVAADREREVVQRYAQALGGDGERLAALLLEISRGATTEPVR